MITIHSRSVLARNTSLHFVDSFAREILRNLPTLHVII